MQQGYTVNPVYSDDAVEQQIVDLEVHSGRNNAVNRDGTYRGWENDLYEDAQGNRVFDPKLGFDELAESTVVGFDEESYTEALLSSNPDIGDALDWGVDNLPQELIDTYNQAVDAGNLDLMHELLDVILGQYRTFNPEEVEEELYDPQEELEEISDEQFDDAIDSLNAQEAGGTELAYQWLEAAEASSDPVFADIAQMTARFHRGEVTSNEAIDAVIAAHGLNKAAKFYRQYMN